MTTSTALWYVPRQSRNFKGRPPSVEIHVNLWRHISRNEEQKNILEIGIRILDTQDIGSLKVFVPLRNEDVEISDLSPLLKNEEIASAVFNALLNVTYEDEGSFQVCQGEQHFVTVHSFQLGVTAIVEEIRDVNGPEGTLVTFTEDLCGKFADPGDHYIRMRFVLRGDAPKAFTSDTSAADGFVLSSVSSSEITEFRLNEARSLPPSIISKSTNQKWKSLRTKTVHYFLVRDISFDLVDAHAALRKIRRLESIWSEYLREVVPIEAVPQLIIYHWRSVAGDGGAIDDVVTLAKFRRSRDNVKLYIAIIVLLGAIGSGMHALLMVLMKFLNSSVPELWVLMLLFIGAGALFWQARRRISDK